ncbi:MAG: hypothetical protein MN733_40875 [Nitrososphaera sp.]|nr:hypothetical protein [Nitrososphaera sp.]
MFAIESVLGRAESPHTERPRHPEYDEHAIEGLMRYFRFNTYPELRWFLNSLSKDRKQVLPEILLE